MARYRILSLDGGGIRGLFTAVLLDRLATRYPKLLQNVDLIAGTSTGGIIALCLAAGKTPADLMILYSQHAKEIFDDSWWDDVKDLGSAIGADYDNRKLKKRLTENLGSKRLRDLKPRVVVPSFDLDAAADRNRPRMWKPKFFHNFPGTDTDGGELAVDVALRTSAAPTYFPSYQGYVDGGVVANNPSMAALATALDTRAGNQVLGDIVLLSLSTATTPEHIAGESLDWGWGEWARPLVSMMIGGVMGVADFQCRQVLGDHYHRVDRYLDRSVKMDSTKSEILTYLVAEAKAVSINGALSWLNTVRW